MVRILNKNLWRRILIVILMSILILLFIRWPQEYSNIEYALNFPDDENILHYNHTSVLLNIRVYHRCGDDMNVTFYDSTDSVICKIENIVSNSNVICNWSGRSNMTNNEWYVNITNGSDILKSAIYDFTILENIKPRISIESPSDNHMFSAGTIITDLLATVTDENGDSMKVTFYNNDTNTEICSDERVSNNSIVLCSWDGLNNGSTYSFYVNALDTGGKQYNSSVVSFSVAEPSISYRYQLAFFFVDSDFLEHKLQPVILNISNFLGCNTPALRVRYNNSGEWKDIDWEWHHERRNGTHSYVYVNETIRFLVNSTNNTIQDNYFIFTYNSPSEPARNKSLFMWYDGFEKGDYTGWGCEDKNPTINIHNSMDTIGNYYLNISSLPAKKDFYFDWEDWDESDLNFGWLAMIKEYPKANKGMGILYGISSIKPPQYGDNWDRHELWFRNSNSFSGVIPRNPVLTYNGSSNVKTVLNFNVIEGKYYAFMLMNLDTSDNSGRADFNFDTYVNEPEGHDWFQSSKDGGEYVRNYNLTKISGIFPLPPNDDKNNHSAFSVVSGIYLASNYPLSNDEWISDEFYVSNGTFFNLYDVYLDITISEPIEFINNIF